LHASRNSLYLVDDIHGSLESSYAAAANDVAQSACREVGVDAMLQSYVYPIMAMINQRTPGTRFQYAGVRNSTAKYAVQLHRPPPCAVVCLGCMKVQSKWTAYRGLGRVSVFSDTDVFRPGGSQENQPFPEAASDPISPGALTARVNNDYQRLVTTGQAVLSLPATNSQAKINETNEVLSRGERIWQWSELLRQRAATGTASNTDLAVLTTVDQAMLELAKLMEGKAAAGS